MWDHVTALTLLDQISYIFNLISTIRLLIYFDLDAYMWRLIIWKTSFHISSHSIFNGLTFLSTVFLVRILYRRTWSADSHSWENHNVPTRLSPQCRWPHNKGIYHTIVLTMMVNCMYVNMWLQCALCNVHLQRVGTGRVNQLTRLWRVNCCLLSVLIWNCFTYNMWIHRYWLPSCATQD
jgi:hypothetical protein